MKKLLINILILTLNTILVLFLLASLVNNGFANKQTTDQVILGACYPSMDNAYYEELNNKINSVTEGYGDVLLSRDALMNQENQNVQIEQLIALGVEGIFVVPVDWVRISPALLKAKEEGVFVVVMETPISQTELADTTVTYDNYDAGIQVAHYLMEQVDAADIVVIQQPNTKSVTDRLEGFVDGINVHSTFRVISCVDGEEQPESIVAAMEQAIAEGIEFDTVFAANDISARATMAVIKKHGIKDVKIVGISGSPEAKSMIKNDEMVVAAALMPVEMGNRAARAMYALLSEGDCDKEIMLPIQLITKQTVTALDMDKWQ